MDEIREAGDAKRIEKKWKATCEQIAKLIAEIEKHSAEFHDTGLAVKMMQRLQAVLNKLKKAFETVITSDPAGAQREAQRAELEGRIRELKRDIKTMHDAEEKDFKAWEEELDSFHLVKPTKTYLAWRGKLMKSQSDWRGLIFELKKLLEDAGPPHNAADANALRPDEDRFKRLVRQSGIQ